MARTVCTLTLVQEQAESPQGDLGGSKKSRAEEEDCDGTCDAAVVL